MTRGPKERPIDYRALYDRYLAGESGTVIAASVGIGFDGLYKAWRRHGWPLRSGRQAARLLVDQDPARARSLIEHAMRVRRGSVDSLETKQRRALTRQRRGLGISPQERELAERLRAEGHRVDQQTAIGPYNVDITLPDRGLAIEIFGGGHNRAFAQRWPTRVAYLEASGWTVLRVWAKSRTVGWQDRAIEAIHRMIPNPL